MEAKIGSFVNIVNERGPLFKNFKNTKGHHWKKQENKVTLIYWMKFPGKISFQKGIKLWRLVLIIFLMEDEVNKTIWIVQK